jgi:hypothetical protein
MVGRARYDLIVHRGGSASLGGRLNPRKVTQPDHVKWSVSTIMQTAMMMSASVSIGAMFMTRTPAAPSGHPSTSGGRT